LRHRASDAGGTFDVADPDRDDDGRHQCSGPSADGAFTSTAVILDHHVDHHWPLFGTVRRVPQVRSDWTCSADFSPGTSDVTTATLISRTSP
jgi:hypothetical protein